MMWKYSPSQLRLASNMDDKAKSETKRMSIAFTEWWTTAAESYKSWKKAQKAKEQKDDALVRSNRPGSDDH